MDKDKLGDIVSLRGDSSKTRSKLRNLKRIAVFGGTFNPIHIGHIKMAEAARKEYKLSYIYFIPCGIPPHKPKEKLFPAKKRYEWIKKSIKNKKYFKVLNVEIKKKKPAYTIDTIIKLKNYLPLIAYRLSLFFLIGADEFEKLHTWKKPNELAKLVYFLVLPRPSKNIKPPKIKNLKWSLVHTKPVNVSSSEIRERIKDKKSVAKLIPFSFGFHYFSMHSF